MARVRALAVVLAALALAAVALAGWVPPALRWPARLGVLFLLPMAAGTAASLLLPRSARRLGSSARVLGTARFPGLIALAVAVDLAAIGAGYALGWATFTYGEQSLEAWKLVAVPLALPFTVAVATLGTEWALHARLWEVAARESSPEAASFLAVGLGAALALPAIVPGFEIADPAVVGSSLVVVLAREAIALRLFQTGGLFVAGAYRGLLLALEGFGIADWFSFWFPMANYVSSAPGFYALRALGAAAALGVVAAATRRREAVA
jgi:hypothetical protein